MLTLDIQFRFQHELLGLPLRRLLKNDAVPTLFDHNKEKQQPKRKSSEKRADEKAKRQFREDAIQHYEQVEDFECELNTKETQTEPIRNETRDFGIQCKIDIDNPTISNEPTIPPINSTAAPLTSDESDYDDDTRDKDYVNEVRTDTETFENVSVDAPSKSAFIVYWESLVLLLKRCLYPACILTTSITKIVYKGSQLIVRMRCPASHDTTWRSQPNCNHYSVGNLTSAASVLFSANTYKRLATFFDLASIQWISKTSFYDIQKRYLFGIVNRNYEEQSNKAYDEIKKHGDYSFCGDGRCDSPGHNAKYLTYSFLDKVTNKIFDFSLTQVTEVGNSNRMEKEGFIKVMSKVKGKGIQPKQMTTDRHTGIRKHIREEEDEMEQQFDIWHFVKSLKKSLRAAAKKASCKIIEKWIKSIGNHLWWCCATYEGDEELLREKWMSVIFHVQNKHRWAGYKKFRKCTHPRLTRKQQKAKEWIKPNTEAFTVLQSIVLDPKLLSELKFLTKFSHTGVLKVYHSLYNRWAPKRQHFSYSGMLARSQLAIMDFNKGLDLKQAKTKEGADRYNVISSKITKNWTAKPIKEEKDRTYLRNMVKQTIELVRSKKSLPAPAIPNLPKNIAPTPKPDKQEVIQNQKSRFGN